MVLLYLNLYICRDWFTHPTAPMNTAHGYWAAIARLSEGWLHPSWWPFWDCGMPFEFTSAPLIPAMISAIAALFHIPHLMAQQAVSAIFYCAAPAAFFLMAWRLTAAPTHSFFAALFYSLLSPAQVLLPDGVFAWSNFLSPHRFNLMALWDETPRIAALSLLFLFILFLVRTIERRHPRSFAAAALSLAFALLATPLAIVPAALATLALLTALRRGILLSTGTVALALALSARFLPPSLWAGVAAAAGANEHWHLTLFPMLAAVAVVWFTLDHLLHRLKLDWRLSFFLIELLQLPRRQGIHLPARRSPAIAHPEHPRQLLEAESNGQRLPHQTDPVRRLRRILSVPSRGPHRARQHPDTFIVPQGIGAHPGHPRQFSRSQSLDQGLLRLQYQPWNRFQGQALFSPPISSLYLKKCPPEPTSANSSSWSCSP
jgi:hypothetical protein